MGKVSVELMDNWLVICQILVALEYYLADAPSTVLSLPFFKKDVEGERKEA